MVFRGGRGSRSIATGRALLGSALAVAVLFSLAPGTSVAASSSSPFPDRFMWGVGGSPGFQSEMGQGRFRDNRSDWWRWTHDRQNIASGTVSGDLPENGPGGFADNFATDIANAKRLGLGAWRMGVEWSRIFPRSTASVKIGKSVSKANLKALDRLANRSAVQRYGAIIRSVRRAGMKPFMVINTYTLPLWVHDPIAMRDALSTIGPDDPVPSGLERSGWLSTRTVTEYRKYAAYLAWKFGGLVDWWVPLNEPMVDAIYGYGNIPGAFAGNFPPGVLSFRSAILALEHMADANAAAFDEIHAKDKRDADRRPARSRVGRSLSAARVGLIHNLIHFVPADPARETDVVATEHAEKVFNRLFPDAAIKGIFDRNGNGEVDPGETEPDMADKADFYGVNYYFRGRVTGLGFSLSETIPLLDFLPSVGYRWEGNPDAGLCPSVCSDFGAEIDPEGLGPMLREAAEYGKPIIVTENGLADADDDLRPGFLVRHLDQVAKVAREKPNGVPVLGWFEWNLTDNYEWAAGFTPKFGLHSFDPETLKRTPRRASTGLLSRIIRANAISGDLLDRYVDPTACAASSIAGC